MAFGKVQIFIVYRCKVVFNRGSRKLTDYFMVVSWKSSKEEVRGAHRELQPGFSRGEESRHTE